MGNDIRVMLVDDHPLVRQGISKILQQEPDIEVVAEAETAEDALQKISQYDPSLLIIDISLKDSIDGIELIEEIKERFESVKTLVLSMHDEAAYIERAIKSGAWGYVTKNDPSSVIIDAVRSIIAGDIYLSASVSRKVVNKLMNIPRKPSAYRGLSERELEVFSLIGMGYVTGEIASQLNLSVNTVESHRRHIKKKLQIVKGSDLLKAAIEYRVNGAAI